MSKRTTQATTETATADNAHTTTPTPTANADALAKAEAEANRLRDELEASERKRKEAESFTADTLLERMWQDALKSSNGDPNVARYRFSYTFYKVVAMLMEAALNDRRLLKRPTESAYSIQKHWEEVRDSAVYRRSTIEQVVSGVS